MKKVNEFLAYSVLAGAIGTVVLACIVVMMSAY